MEWEYIKPLSSAELIKEFEAYADYSFPEDFINCVILNNGGYPSLDVFDTDRTEERTIKSLLSFNKDDRETIWMMNERSEDAEDDELEDGMEDLPERYVAFAIDDFGNLICFDKDNDNIVFYDHEEDETEYIADSFTEFLEKLYD